MNILDDEEEYKKLFLDNAESMYWASTVLDEVVGDIRKFLENFEVPFDDIDCSDVINALENEIDVLKNSIPELIKFTKQITQSEITNKKELTNYEKRCEELHELRTTQNDLIKKLKSELQTVKFQMQQQNIGFMKVLSVLGQLVYEATLDEKTTNSFVSTSEMSEFFQLIKESVEEFIHTYANKLPSEKTNEMKYMKTIIRIVINITSHSKSRYVMAADSNGRTLIRMFIDILPEIPLPSGKKILEYVMILLFNVSMSKKGVIEIKCHSEIWKSLSKIIDQSFEHPEYKAITEISLKLTQSALMDVTESDIMKSVLEAFTEENIDKWEQFNFLQNYTTLKDIKELLLQMKQYSSYDCSVNF